MAARTAPVLCAVDVTPLAECAVRFAAVFARLTGASIALFHAVERGEGAGVAARLAGLAGMLQGTGLDVLAESASGDPAEAIVRRARALSASAIVMGTHGGRGVERLMLGSVAETVLHRAGRPMATLRGPGHADGPIRRIVCGADLVDPAPLRFAADLARRSSAELLVVHAVQDLPEEGGLSFVPASYGQGLLEEGRTRLGEAVALLLVASPHVPVRTRVVPGPASRALLRIAADESADLLVVGIHPHVLGSTTHPIVRGAGCPVLSVPGAAGGETA